VLFCFLLTLSGSLLILAAGLWYSAHRALLDIDETITTIAIPDSFFIEAFAQEHGISEEEVFGTLRNTVYTSGLFNMDSRRVFNAFAEGISPAPLQTSGAGLEPNFATFSPLSVSAFAVTCVHINTLYSGGIHWDEETMTDVHFLWRMHRATFTVDEILHLHHSYETPRYITIYFHSTPSGSIPFDPGSQYIILGNISMGTGWPRSFQTFTFLESPNVPLHETITGYAYNQQQFTDLIAGEGWRWGQIPYESFPIEILEFAYEREPEPQDGAYSFFQIDGSLEDALASDWWLQVREDTLTNAEISANSFQILTTNDANSLFRLNQNRNLFYDGRMITSREHREGARVALVSRDFAEANDLSVGDTIPLEFYATVLGEARIEYQMSPPYGRFVTQSIWVPSLYHSGLEISEPIDFTIIGIMHTLMHDISPYAIMRNTVIIPDNSFVGITGEPVSLLPVPEHIPLLADGLIVPNGQVEEIRAAINSIAPGYASLLRYFDQGYRTLAAALGNLRFGMGWILVLVVFVWIAVAFMFSMFYTARKRKEAAALYSLGVNRRIRFRWVFSQSLMLILFSLGISLAVTLPIFGYIIDAAASLTETLTTEFRDLTLSNAADSGIRSRIPLVASPVALLITAGIGSTILLVITGIMSVRIVKFTSLALMKGED